MLELLSMTDEPGDRENQDNGCSVAANEPDTQTSGPWEDFELDLSVKVSILSTLCTTSSVPVTFLISTFSMHMAPRLNANVIVINAVFYK